MVIYTCWFFHMDVNQLPIQILNKTKCHQNSSIVYLGVNHNNLEKPIFYDDILHTHINLYMGYGYTQRVTFDYQS